MEDVREEVGDIFSNLDSLSSVVNTEIKLVEKAKEKRTIRAGKGKMRGRRYKKRTGPLVVVSQPCALLKSARNIPGIDVALVHHINIELLAPGGHPGRLTLFTKGSLEKIRKDKLFSEASA